MNETKHTPGPWRATKPEKSNGYHYIDAPDTVCGKVAVCYSDNAAANARLIAAAPDLLEALQTLMQRAAALDQSATHEGVENCNAIAAARAAIARATGGQI